MNKQESIQYNTKTADTRKLISDLCRVQGDFRRFLCDEFPYLQRQISTEITYDKQINELIDRETCAEILIKLRRHAEDINKEGRFKEKRYLEIINEIKRVSEFPEPQLRNSEFKHPRRSKWLRKIMRACLQRVGIIALWEVARWAWSRINSIRVEGGTIVIVGTAGGGLYLSLGSGSCRYETPHQGSLPAWSMASTAPAGLNLGQARRTVNFCVRGITVLQEGEPVRPLPPGAVDSKQVQQSQQLIYQLNMLLSMYSTMDAPKVEVPEFTAHIVTQRIPNYGRNTGSFMQEPALTTCQSDQGNRLPINIVLKWKRKTEAAVRNCFPNQNCSDARKFTISCEFSYSIADIKDEYRCPNKTFTILSDGVSFLKPPALSIQQELQQLQQNTNPTDIEFSTILNQCGGAFSAITLLAACKNP